MLVHNHFNTFAFTSALVKAAATFTTKSRGYAPGLLRNEGVGSFHGPVNPTSVRTSRTEYILRGGVRQSQKSGIVEPPCGWYNCFVEKNER